MLKVGDTVTGAYGRPFRLKTQAEVKWAINQNYKLLEESPMDMIEEARKIYSEACQGAGEKPEFTTEVAELVGATADDYEDLAMRFKIERDIMERAYRKATLIAESMDEDPCIECGNMVKPNTKVCPHCGAGSEFR